MQLLPYSRHSNSIILHFLPFPGEVRENDPSQEFGTQGAIQALNQLRHHGQLYLVFRSSHDSDTPSTQWSYCRPEIPVCWMQLQGQGQCRMTKAPQLQIVKGPYFILNIHSLSGMPPPSKNKHIPQLSPVLTVIFDANKMCYTSPLIDHNQTLVPTFSLSAPIK